jgi:hypothetical protein
MTAVHTALIHCDCHLAIPRVTECSPGEAMMEDLWSPTVIFGPTSA